jgi:hypothetical protein
MVPGSKLQRPVEKISLVLTTALPSLEPNAIAAMKQFSEALLCSTCDPDGDVTAKGSAQ